MGRKKRSDLTVIRSQFPSIDNLDWARVFRDDPEVWGRVYRDILKYDQAPDGRPGPRPALDPVRALSRLHQLTDNEFTMLPFREALKILSKNMPVRQMANKTGLERNVIQRILSGTRQPDNYEIRTIAAAFNLKPSYFVEYRIAFILLMMNEHMMRYPESSVPAFLKVRDAIGMNP